MSILIFGTLHLKDDNLYQREECLQSYVDYLRKKFDLGEVEAAERAMRKFDMQASEAVDLALDLLAESDGKDDVLHQKIPRWSTRSFPCYSSSVDGHSLYGRVRYLSISTRPTSGTGCQRFNDNGIRKRRTFQRLHKSTQGLKA